MTEMQRLRRERRDADIIAGAAMIIAALDDYQAAYPTSTGGQGTPACIQPAGGLRDQDGRRGEPADGYQLGYGPAGLRDRQAAARRGSGRSGPLAWTGVIYDD